MKIVDVGINIRTGIYFLFFSFFMIKGSAQTIYDHGSIETYAAFVSDDTVSGKIKLIGYSHQSFGLSPFENFIMEIDDTAGVVSVNNLYHDNIAPAYYGFIQSVDFGHLVLTKRVDSTKAISLSSTLIFEESWELCKLRNDSITDCTALCPDSVFPVGFPVYYEDPRSGFIHFFGNWFESQADSVLKSFWVKYNIFSGIREVKEIGPLEKDGNEFALKDFSPPIRLDNGEWLVMASHKYPGGSIGSSILRMSPSWDSVINWTGHKFHDPPFSRFWKVGKKIILSSTGDLASWGGISGSQYKAPLSLMEYDVNTDSIVNSYNFGLPSINNQLQHNEVARAIYKDGHFFIGGNISSALFSYQRGMLFLVVDTNFNEVKRLAFRDTTQDLLFGSVTDLTVGVGGKYFYAGCIGNQVLTGKNPYNLDLFFGMMDINEIGLDEGITLHKQQTWLYPNPSDGRFTLENQAKPFEPYTIQIIDGSGKVVFEKKIGEPKVDILTNLSAGYYYVITDGGDILGLNIK